MRVVRLLWRVATRRGFTRVGLGRLVRAVRRLLRR
jgi:hypothetical protein